MMVSICGASGFIGRHIMTVFPQGNEISLREDSWRDKITETDVLINLIGKAHDHGGIATEADYYYANLELVKKVFDAFKVSSAAVLVHISSLAAVEEFESPVPLTEEHDCHPYSWYGQSKRAAEEWLMSQKLPQGKKVIILRPPMVHGPGDKGNLGLLYKLVSKGIPYPLAAFDNRRSFISINNFCFLLEKIIRHHDEMDTGIYHMADDEPLSTQEIIRLIGEVTGRKIVNLPIPKLMIQAVAKLGEVLPIPLNNKRLKKMTSDLLVSNTKIKMALGIDKLPVTAREGMMHTIRSF